MPRPRRCIPAYRRTSGPVPCAACWMRRSARRWAAGRDLRSDDMSRQVSYRWRLRKAMADADMFTSTALIGPLAERGVALSASQVHRLVTGTPERLNMTVLAALCDILHRSEERRVGKECRSTPPPEQQ